MSMRNTDNKYVAYLKRLDFRCLSDFNKLYN
jgi:hypothetical protein